ncbi:hypothetical protein EB796_022150 [Bugula neritina]|uniref:Bromo domain-containing protein n=1 Tax=Bugula neritina TaxID=10212 RepID=A0A7J7J1D6_BUGNE|nr:hypothetical protein EB796_022150 [Bugula neritina]
MVKRAAKRSRKDVSDPKSSLKMVLKVSAADHATSRPTSPSTSALSQDSDDDKSLGRSSNKKSRTTGTGRQSPPTPTPLKKGITANDFVPAERNLRDRHRAPSPKPHNNALQDTLLYLHKLIEKRDTQHFFAFPINDMIAPDYSHVIKNPMDFSTMKEKIDKKEYTSIMEYKGDVKLICVNAMNYNHPDTVYYKAAQKLLEYAMRTLSKDRLLSLRRNQPMMSSLTDSELSLHLDVDASDYIAASRQQKKQRDVNSYLTFEPIPDHLPAKDIIAMAKERATEAENNLKKCQPNAKFGFLGMEEDGTTYLNVLNPDNTGFINDKERIITLGEKVNKLKAGVPYLESIPADDESTDMKLVQYLNYGPFSSGAPTHDSTFSTLSKTESDMVLSFYGSQNGLDYIQSLRSFVADGSDELINTIDSLANLWTGGKHTEAQNILKETRELAAKEVEQQRQEAIKALKSHVPNSQVEVSKSPSTQSSSFPATPAINYESMKSIAELGIDTSFLDHFEKTNSTQKELEKVSDQLTELNTLQTNRLSLPCYNDKVGDISEQEDKLAQDVQDDLAGLTKQAIPSDISDESKIRSSLGVGLVPTHTKSDSDVVEDLLKKVDNERPEAEPIETLCHSVPLGQSPTQSS